MASSKLKVIRGGGYTDVLRAYKIFVNDEQVGTLERDAVLNREVQSGPLKLEARLDWTRSQPLMVNAVPGETIEVEVSNRGGPLLSFWDAIFRSRNYLALKRLSEMKTQ